MKHTVGDKIKIRRDLNLNWHSNMMKNNQRDTNIYEWVNPIEYFFRGCEVEIIEVHTDHEIKGYGVKYKDSRKFFVHETHVEEI